MEVPEKFYLRRDRRYREQVNHSPHRKGQIHVHRKIDNLFRQEAKYSHTRISYATSST